MESFLKYADMHSFYYQARQIFGEALYHFTCDTDAPVILDCGAHIGLASLYFKDIYPNARIRAFEADPEIATMCDANLTSLGHDAFTVEAKAIWINNDGVSFSDSKDDAGHIELDQTGSPIVPSVRLKDVLSQERVHLLKLDIEGAEFEVLEDCDEALLQVERMVIEVHVLHPQHISIGGLLNQIESLGFRYILHDLHHATWVSSDVSPPFAACPTDKYIVTVFAWQP